MTPRAVLSTMAIAALTACAQYHVGAQPSHDPAPTPAGRDGDPKAVSARVLGEPVTRGNLAAASEARRTHRFPDGRTAQVPEDRAAQVATIDLILMPLVEHAARTHGFELTEAEIENHHGIEERWRGRMKQALSPAADAERAAVAAESMHVQLADVEVMEEDQTRHPRGPASPSGLAESGEPGAGSRCEAEQNDSDVGSDDDD